jgi:hypothetical protein
MHKHDNEELGFLLDAALIATKYCPNMEEQETDRLIADFLAITFEAAQHLHERRRLTTLQRDCLSNSVEGLNAFLAAWKNHESLLMGPVDG